MQSSFDVLNHAVSSQEARIEARTKREAKPSAKVLELYAAAAFDASANSSKASLCNEPITRPGSSGDLVADVGNFRCALRIIHWGTTYAESFGICLRVFNKLHNNPAITRSPDWTNRLESHSYIHGFCNVASLEMVKELIRGLEAPEYGQKLLPCHPIKINFLLDDKEKNVMISELNR
jgi:hypothetical protein